MSNKTGADGLYREESWFVIGALSTGFFITMAFWDVLGVLDATLLGFASVFAVYTIASAPRLNSIDNGRGES